MDIKDAKQRVRDAETAIGTFIRQQLAALGKEGIDVIDINIQLLDTATIDRPFARMLSSIRIEARL